MTITVSRWLASSRLCFPELIEPEVELHEACCRYRVDTLCTLRLYVDQAGVKQDSQMLRHGWARHRQTGGKLADCFRTPAQLLEEIATVRVRNRHEGVGEGHWFFVRQDGLRGKMVCPN